MAGPEALRKPTFQREPDDLASRSSITCRHLKRCRYAQRLRVARLDRIAIGKFTLEFHMVLCFIIRKTHPFQIPFVIRYILHLDRLFTSTYVSRFARFRLHKYVTM